MIDAFTRLAASLETVAHFVKQFGGPSGLHCRQEAFEDFVGFSQGHIRIDRQTDSGVSARISR